MIALNLPDVRDSARRNMLITAVLRRGSQQAPVKIRNMSALGALIDSPFVPEPNSKVQLVRGSYVAEGRVVWSEARRCGIRFLSELCVRDWLAPVDAQPTLQGAEPDPLRPCRRPEPEPFAIVALADLLKTAALIERTARTLAQDPHFLRDHMTEGRDLMSAAQILSRMCDQVDGSA